MLTPYANFYSVGCFSFFGARGQQAGRRYAAPLAGLLGPAAALPPGSGPLGHGCAALGQNAPLFRLSIKAKFDKRN